MRKAKDQATKVQTKGVSQKEVKDLMKDIFVDDIEVSKNVSIPKEMRSYLESLGDSKMVVRYMSDQYKQIQEFRIRNQNQLRSLVQGYDLAGSDHEKVLMTNLIFAENQEALNKKYIDIITDGIPICQWMKSIVGIGPIFAAALYSTFDVTKASYATNFLSYAGLNDNNNPWLGTEKAKKMIGEAVDNRNEKFKEIEYQFRNELEREGVTDFTAFKKKIIELIKKLVEGEEKKRSKQFDKKSVINFGTKTELAKVYMDLYYDTPWDIFPLIKKAAKDVAKVNAKDFAETPHIYEYLLCLAYPKYAGDMLIQEISDITTRQVVNIKKGIISGMLTKYNSADKKIDFTMPMIKDFESYLAKPPYNIDLKKKCYLIGDSFIKQRSRGSMYGKIYYARLQQETAANEKFAYKDQAEKLLSEKNFDKNKESTKTLMEGKLTASHLTARARRYAVKLFISHVYEAMYYDVYREQPPMPYIIAIEGHHDYIAPEVDYKKFLK